MSEEITEFTPFELSDGRTVIELCGDFYRVQAIDGSVSACQARTEATGANAEADIITDPPPVRVSVPQVMGAGYIKAAFIALGHATDESNLNSQVETALGSSGLSAVEQAVAKALFFSEPYYVRTNSKLIAVCQLLGLSDAQIDTIFITAGGMQG